MPASKLVIAGGGPAGMMAGLLFARAGVPVTVLEKHGDFLRDFRGDTVHPSTIALFDELGLAEALLAREHDSVTDISAKVGGRLYRVADLSHLPVRHKFMMMMPQWHFLDFVRDEASRWPGFSLRMETEVTGLHQEDGRVRGVVRRGASRIALPRRQRARIVRCAMPPASAARCSRGGGGRCAMHTAASTVTSTRWTSSPTTRRSTSTR